MCHWHGSSCQPSWLLYCCRKHLVQLHAELTPWAELWEHSLYQLSVARWLRPTGFAATPSLLGWVSHFQWSNTNTGNYFYFSLSMKEILITFNFWFFFWRMIWWLGKDAWRSLKLFVVIISYSIWHMKFQLCLLKPHLHKCLYAPFLPLGHKRNLMLLSSSSLGNWGKRQIPSDLLQLNQKIMALSATKTEFNKFQTSVFNTKSASLIFCFYILAQWPRLNKQEVISNHMSWNFNWHTGSQAKTTIGLHLQSVIMIF